MKYLLDTNTLSYIVKGQSPAARAKLAELGGDEIACISSITEAEIRYGLAKAANANALRSAIEGFLSKIRILPWDSEEAIAYGDLRANLESLGRTLGNTDMLIAAHAIAASAVLVTNDRSFGQVANLKIANWATEI